MVRTIPFLNQAMGCADDSNHKEIKFQRHN